MNLNTSFKTLLVFFVIICFTISCQKEEVIFVQEVVAEQVTIEQNQEQDNEAGNEDEQNQQDDVERISYSFYVAGHTTGKPGVDNEGLHPPFRAQFDFINNESTIEFGIFTGDIVSESNERNWNEAEADIALLNKPVFFTAGNRDIGDRALFESRYGITYNSFIANNDLFIILDPNLDNWNISGNQLAFLQNTLNANRANVDNVFIFFHQLLWWSPDNIYQRVIPNSLSGRGEEVNFWDEVEPLLNNINNDVFLFAGDVGAFPNGSEFMYDTFDNITLVASGMGGEERDNFVIIDVTEDGNVNFRLIAINGDDPNALGNLEDYILP